MEFHLSHFIFLLCASSVREGNATIFKGAMEFAGGILNFANFAQFLNHKLNATVKESRTVVSDKECILACTESLNCRSLNIKITPDANRKYTCQILDTDKFVSHDLFAATSEFHHYSCTVSFFLIQFLYFYFYFVTFFCNFVLLVCT